MKKSKNLFGFLATAAIFLLVSGCRKSLNEEQGNSLLSPGKQNNSLFKPDVVADIYVAGVANGQAAYWKNGLLTTLSGGTVATGIVIVGTDIYVSGYGISPTTGRTVAESWKNGVLTTLTDGSDNARAVGIAASGTDVYVAGFSGQFAHTGFYWKNGVVTSLGSGQPSGIFVSGTDVYIPNGATGGATYWLNGVLTTIPGAPASSRINAIAVQGGNVHAVGVNSTPPTQTAIYWKNNVKQTIVTGTNSDAMSVATNSSGQAILAGTSGDFANQKITYWNASFDLQAPLSTGTFSGGTGLAIDQTSGDIYVCGTVNSTAMYWRIDQSGTATPVSLTSSPTTGSALAITLQ